MPTARSRNKRALAMVAVAATALSGASLWSAGPAQAAVELSFTEATLGPVPDGVEAIVAADLNGDGRDDYVTTGGSSDLGILLSTTSGFTPSTITAGGRAERLAVVDANDDGRADIVASYWGGVSLFLQQTSGGLAEAAAVPVSTLGGDAGYGGIAAADLDGDGDDDLAVGNWGDRSVTPVYQTAGGLQSGTAVATSTSGAPEGIVAADLDGDDVPEIATANYTANSVTVLTRGAGGSYAGSTVPFGSAVGAVDAGDVDGDGIDELVSAQTNSGQVSVTEKSGGTWSASDAGGINGLIYGLTVGDVDDDQRAEIAYASWATGGLGVLDRSADGSFTRTDHVVNQSAGPVDIVRTDANGDGLDDFVLADYYLDTARLVTNTSTGGSGDTTAPVTTDDVPTAEQTSPVTVTLTATDEAGGSGVAQTRYTIGTAANPPADPRTDGTVYDAAAKPVLTDGEVVRYSSTDLGGNVEAPKTSAAAQVVATVTKPVIGGVAQVGRTLNATATSSTPGAQVVYRWFRAGTATPVGTGPGYTPVNADAGRQLTVVALAGAPGYRTVSSTSDPVIVTAPPVPSSYTVKATGGTRVGTVRVAETSLDDDSIRLAYQWQRANNTGGWVDLPGADAKKARYELPPAVMKLNVRVEVTATRGTSKVVKASAPLVILPGEHKAGDPRVTGTLETGEKVTAVYDDAVEPDGLKVTYSWTIGGNEIRLTGRTITLPQKAAGKKIICDIRLTAPGYHNQEMRTPARTVKK